MIMAGSNQQLQRRKHWVIPAILRWLITPCARCCQVTTLDLVHAQAGWRTIFPYWIFLLRFDGPCMVWHCAWQRSKVCRMIRRSKKPKEVKIARRLYAAGYSKAMIARQLQCSRLSVQRWTEHQTFTTTYLRRLAQRLNRLPLEQRQYVLARVSQAGGV